MVKDEIIVNDQYKIVYMDNFFAKLHTAEWEIDEVVKVSILPEGSQVGDIIQNFFNRTKNLDYYEIISKCNMPQFELNKLCFISNEKICANGSLAEKMLFNVDENGVGVFESEKFYKSESYTEIVEKFKNERKIKNVSKFEISRWVVYAVFNHTVCLANIYNIDEKRYIADTELELNSKIGSMYYYIKLNNFSRYVYDEENTLTLPYPSLLSDLNYLSIKNGLGSEFDKAKEEMKKYDKKNSKLFAEQVKYEFVQSFAVIEREDITERGKKFRCADANDLIGGEDVYLYEDELPLYAEEGDYVGKTACGKYFFDRETFLAGLKKVEENAKRKRL